jgi:CrcB protein
MGRPDPATKSGPDPVDLGGKPGRESEPREFSAYPQRGAGPAAGCRGIVPAMGFLIVFLGAGLGGMARHGVGLAALRFGTAFPYGTMGINILGSILMGVLAGWYAMRSGSQPMRLFLATGVLGGFTTFSSYALEGILLLERGEMAAAIIYILGSVVLGLAGLLLGLMVMRMIL